MSKTWQPSIIIIKDSLRYSNVHKGHFFALCKILTLAVDIKNTNWETPTGEIQCQTIQMILIRICKKIYQNKSISFSLQIVEADFQVHMNFYKNSLCWVDMVFSVYKPAEDNSTSHNDFFLLILMTFFIIKIEKYK